MTGFDSELFPWLAYGAGVVALLALILWYLRRRRRLRSPAARLRQAADDVLTNFLVPDGDGGEIHVECAVLTPAGVLIVDLKQVEGHVFGSDTMQDWTVIASRRRFTFSNPQPALYDRMAAVKRLLPDVPVSGCVAFTAGADFSKGLPSQVALFDELIADLAHERREAGPIGDALRSGWDFLRQEAVTAQVGQLMRDT